MKTKEVKLSELPEEVTNLSVNDTFSKTILILSLSITSTKIGKYPEMSKHFKYLQDSPGYVNVNSQVTLKTKGYEGFISKE